MYKYIYINFVYIELSVNFGEVLYVSLSCPGYNGKAAISGHIYDSGGVLGWAVC